MTTDTTMTSRFWTPANIQDFPNDSAKQSQLNDQWNTNLSGFTQQGIVGNPWNSINQSNQTLYFDPLVTGPNDRHNYSVTPVAWSPLPGRIGYYFPSLIVNGKPTNDYYSLADTGYYTDGTTTFGDITNNPCGSIMNCSDTGTNEPYGPYGPRGWQDEYCEWSVVRGDPTPDYPLGPILRIDFTCENPEYWNSLWMVDPNKVLELYRSTLGKPQIQLADLYLYNGDQIVTDPSTGRPAYNPLNKWNSGTVSTDTHGGAMHLTSTPNTLQTEIQLAAGATVQRTNGVTYSQNELLCCGQYGQVARNSDPNIGYGVNQTVATVSATLPCGSTVSLANPPGLYIQPPTWKLFKNPKDPNTEPHTFWKIVRGSKVLVDQNKKLLPGEFILHATFEVPTELGYTVSDLQVNGQNIIYAAQVVETMLMHILAASYALTSAPPTFDCVWCCQAPTPPSFAQPLQMFHADVWNAMYAKKVKNPVQNPIALASNSTLIAPLVKAGSTYSMVLTAATTSGTPTVTATLNGVPDEQVTIAVTGVTSVNYAVPGNTYPSEVTALSLTVTVSANAQLGVRGITVTNPGDAVQVAMPSLLNVVAAT